MLLDWFPCTLKPFQFFANPVDWRTQQRLARGMALRTFDGSVSIVTGAASGIGRALAERLAGSGSSVVLADRQFKLLDELAREISDRGGRASAVELDVRCFAEQQRLVSKTMQDEGRLDYLFNNAGIGVGGDIDLHTEHDWEQIIDVNVKGVAFGVQAALGPMLAQGFGHIVNTASISGLIPLPGLVAYCMSKHAIVGLSKSLRGEVAKAGIRVSALCPGPVDTPLLTGGRFGRFHGVSGDAAKHILSPIAPMDSAWFATKALKAVKKNKPLIVLPWQYKILWLLMRRLPTSWEIYLATKHMKHKRQQAETLTAA